ncbi:TRAP transporter small permease subunit [Cohaesibacter celericrescens]|uniref:TRAP transporter small permease protein n=1 Tax=Cohaesibacter celericrescens TaxID=2067669 RepID=A0A2N5XME3_9HYPH|nr:TRAP transporter small permease subunit [Cohaesibacter celericrescens]PLW75701.1 C4-dicarboxylate ABC transporter [Cohaesibacter celericrescens]
MKALLRFIDLVDGFNLRVGRVVMYGLFVLMAILLWSSVSKTFFSPSLWTLEMAQFAMVAYYMLGGPYSLLMGSNVRMDLFYGDWSKRRKAAVDCFTVLFLVYYLGVLLYGGLSSTAYSLGYWGSDPISYFVGLIIGSEEVGRLERSSTAWRPYVWPIKAIMVTGVLMMLLQALAELGKDIARLAGHSIPEVKE